MIRAHARKAKEALDQMVITIMECTPNLEAVDPKLVNFISLHGEDEDT